MPQERNVELIRRVAKTILDRPEGYDQETWHDEIDADPDTNACGTTHCIAGHAIALSGYRYGWEHPNTRTGSYGIFRVSDNEFIGTEHHSSDLGRDLMGLTEEEAVHLFNGEFIPKAYDHEGVLAHSVADVLFQVADGAYVEGL